MSRYIPEYVCVVENTKQYKLLEKYHDKSIKIEKAVEIISFLKKEFKIRHLEINYDARCTRGHASYYTKKRGRKWSKQRYFTITLPRFSIDEFKKNNKEDCKQNGVTGLRKGLIFHELAHILVMLKDGDENDIHGPKFIKWLDKILRVYKTKYEKKVKA